MLRKLFLASAATVLVTACVISTTGQAHAAEYSFEVVNDPDGNAGNATGVNNLGQVVGSYHGSDNVSYGFVNTDGVFTVVNAPGASNTDYMGTYANSINDAGDVAGYYMEANTRQHGFVKVGGMFTTIDVPGAIATEVYGINNAGQLVGNYVSGEDYNVYGFLFAAGVLTTIIDPNQSEYGETWVAGINNKGQVVGSYSDDWTGSNGVHGFLYDAGMFTTIDAPDVASGAGGNGNTWITGINDAGEAVGHSSRLGAFTELGGVFDAIDGVGLPDWYTLPGVAISDTGQIVGYGFKTVNAKSSPNDGSDGTTAVPEPASATLLGLGLAALGFIKRRHPGAIPKPQRRMAAW